MNWNLERHASLDSTNRLAYERAQEGVPAGLVVVAGEQTAGRGRRDNRWHSPGGGLWFTLLLRPPHIEGLSLVAALGVGSALSVDWQLHWPNDLYCGTRKLAGVLVESRLSGSGCEFALVGVGLNANNSDFPPELVATSLALELGHEIDLEQQLQAVLNSLSTYLDRYEREGLESFLDELRLRCPMVGSRVRYLSEGQEHEAVAVGFAGDGALQLEDGTVLRTVDRIDLVS